MEILQKYKSIYDQEDGLVVERRGNVKAISLEEAIKVMDIDEATLEEFLVFLGGTMIRAVKTILTTSRQQFRDILCRELKLDPQAIADERTCATFQALSRSKFYAHHLA